MTHDQGALQDSAKFGSLWVIKRQTHCTFQKGHVLKAITHGYCVKSQETTGQQVNIDYISAISVLQLKEFLMSFYWNNWYLKNGVLLTDKFVCLNVFTSNRNIGNFTRQMKIFNGQILLFHTIQPGRQAASGRNYKIVRNCPFSTNAGQYCHANNHHH